ncbi:MAG: hypothetical protein V1851_02145 [Patescibacteria group bacterium]
MKKISVFTIFVLLVVLESLLFAAGHNHDRKVSSLAKGSPAVIVAVGNKEPITGMAIGTWQAFPVKTYVFDGEGSPCSGVWVYADSQGKGFFEKNQNCLLSDAEGKVVFNFKTGTEDDHVLFSVGVANNPSIKYEFEFYWWKIWAQLQQFQSDISLNCNFYKRNSDGEIDRDSEGRPYIVIPAGETREVSLRISFKTGVLPEQEPVFSDLWEGALFSDWNGNIDIVLTRDNVGDHNFRLSNGKCVLLKTTSN